jgi:lysophospholipase L1-like esterase
MRMTACLVAALALLAACGGDDVSDSASTPIATSPAPIVQDIHTVAPTPTPTTVRGPALYLALGDSLSEGIGASIESETAFVPLVHVALPPDVALLNLGKAGDDSEELLSEGLLDQGIEEIERRLSDGIDGNEVRLVTLEIGGNDLLDIYFDFVVPGECPSVIESLQDPLCVQLLEDALAQYRPNLREILARLRAAGPDIPVFLMTLYNPFSGGSSTIDELGELALEGQPGTPFPEGMNDIIRAEGAAAGAIVVDWHPLFRPSAAGLISTDLIHPNDDGYRRMADAIITAARPLGLLD